MPHSSWFTDLNKTSVSLAGGKGASLGELTNAGIPVPPGFVVLSTAFDRFLAETRLGTEIKARLAEVNIQDTNSVEHASAIIRATIHDQAIPLDLQQEIIAQFKKLGVSYVAVRSSATAEDSAIASWAGELETYLNTTEGDLIERVKRCWSSLYTPRAIFYRHEKNLFNHEVSVAVVIQTMVQSEISGVAFTVHPVTEDYDQLIIEAGLGLGEAIVSGQITPDSYIVSKSTLTIMDISVNEQTKKLIRRVITTPDVKLGYEDSETMNEWVPLDQVAGNKQKMSGQQIIEAAQVFIAIEKHYGFPVDIEWALEKGKLYITQSRPITTLIKKI